MKYILATAFLTTCMSTASAQSWSLNPGLWEMTITESHYSELDDGTETSTAQECWATEADATIRLADLTTDLCTVDKLTSDETGVTAFGTCKSDGVPMTGVFDLRVMQGGDKVGYQITLGSEVDSTEFNDSVWTNVTVAKRIGDCEN